MSFSTQLLSQLEPALGALRRRQTDWNPGDRLLLRRWFLLVWQAVRASEPLLEWATQELRRGPRNAFSDLLSDYYTLLAVERRGQDESLLDDLASLGVEPDLATLQLPNRHIAAMVGSQYYLIRHYHPVLLLGYIAFCESQPPRRKAIEELRTHSATSERLWRTCLSSAERAPLHLEELRLVLDEVPLRPPPLRPGIVVNALRCVATYAVAIDSICQRKVIKGPALMADGGQPCVHQEA